MSDDEISSLPLRERLAKVQEQRRSNVEFLKKLTRYKNETLAVEMAQIKAKIDELYEKIPTMEMGFEKNDLIGVWLDYRKEYERLKEKHQTIKLKIAETNRVIHEIDAFYKQIKINAARELRIKLEENQRNARAVSRPQRQASRQEHFQPRPVRVATRPTKSNIQITPSRRRSLANALRRRLEAEKIKSHGSLSSLNKAMERQNTPRQVDNVTRRKVAKRREDAIQNQKITGVYRRRAADIAKSRSSFRSRQEHEAIQTAQERVRSVTNVLKNSQSRTIIEMVKAGADLRSQDRQRQQRRLIENTVQAPSGVETAIQAIHDHATSLSEINWIRENANLTEIIVKAIKEFCRATAESRTKRIPNLQGKIVKNLSQILDVIMMTRAERFQNVNPSTEKDKKAKILNEFRGVINDDNFFEKCFDVTMAIIRKYGFDRYPRIRPSRTVLVPRRDPNAIRKQTKSSIAKSRPSRSDTSIARASQRPSLARQRSLVRPRSQQSGQSMIPQVSESRLVRRGSVDTDSRPATSSGIQRSRRLQRQDSQSSVDSQAAENLPRSQNQRSSPGDSYEIPRRPLSNMPRSQLRRRFDESEPSQLLMSIASKRAKRQVAAFSKIPDLFQDFLKQFCYHILTIKNSQVSDEQKVIDMVKALRPLIQHIALMQYPNEDEEPQRQKVHLQWAQAIIDFVSTILTQNLTLTKCQDITERNLHRTGAIPLTDGQRALINFLEMVEKLVEPSAKNFGDEVVEAFVQAGIIRNDAQKERDAKLERKRLELKRSAGIQPVSRISRQPTPREELNRPARLMRSQQQTPSRPVSRETQSRPVSRETPSRQTPRETPSSNPLAASSLLRRTPRRVESARSTPAVRPSPIQEESPVASPSIRSQTPRTPSQIPRRAVTPRAPQLEGPPARRFPARGARRAPAQVGTPLAPSSTGIQTPHTPSQVLVRRAATPRAPRIEGPPVRRMPVRAEPRQMTPTEETEESRIRRADLKRPKLVERNFVPIECITPDGRRRDDIPNHILASDLLGLGCILIKNPELQVAVDGTASNALVGSVRRIAEYWSNYEISEARAFNILGKLLENIPCFPRELYKLICVAVRDYFFPNKEHVHRAFEIQARTEKIKEIYKKVIGICPEQFRTEVGETYENEFLAKYVNESIVLHNDPEIIAEILITAEKGIPITATPNLVFGDIVRNTRLMSAVRISGREIVRTDPGNSLPLVTAIDRSAVRQALGTRTKNKINAQLQLLPGPVPQPNFARKNLVAHFENLEENSAQVEDEEESEVPTNTVFLTPKPLMRQNFCQLRGSSFPKWFPGYYATFPDSGWKGLKLVKSPSHTMLNAWRKMCPIIVRE